MSKHLVELFQKTIHRNLYLDRDGKNWSSKETPRITMKVPTRHSLGFSLDCRRSPFDSFLAANPPSGIAKMCDGIIVLSHKDNAYIFVVEQKTANKDEYKKQLANGKYFCDWLLVLLKEHKHYNGEVTFIGLLCWQPRESPSKGMTHHIKDLPSNKPNPCHRLFEVKNEDHIRLLRFIK